MPVEVVEEPDTARAIDDRVVRDQRLTLVLHRNPCACEVVNHVVHHDGRTFVAQDNAVIVASRQNVPCYYC